MIDFFIKVKQQFQQNLPFVIYSKPNIDKLSGLFQKNNQLYLTNNFNEKGFVFAPFDAKQVVLISERESELIEIEFTSNPIIKNPKYDTFTDELAKNNFENLVKKAICAIENGSFNKVVLSREEIINLPNFDLVSLFEELVNFYPTVYTYCWFHPKIGLWMGATPERFLKVIGKEFHTVALAGTQLFQYNKDVVWGNKEQVEQQFVTDYILETIKNLTSAVEITSPYTLKAGNLLHLKTDIKGRINEEATLKQLVLLLHPTPAVCGFPKKSAIDFIIENEGYNRSFYAGFLGEINKNENLETDLFVNLRCMQIRLEFDKIQAHSYIGCGITKDSNPENEWQETENKAMTMKNIIL
ncbi:MAG: isochorismate synthase [Flavobacteriaceae bacterium]|nr:isochorismate synthase [Flavobacteriaceae bacterium]